LLLPQLPHVTADRSLELELLYGLVGITVSRRARLVAKKWNIGH
jgi:hypothetical protein